MTVTFQNTIVLIGTCTLATTHLWHVQLPTNMPQAPVVDHAAFSTIGAATSAQLAALAHAELFLLALSTIDQALARGYLTNFPGLTRELLCKHDPPSLPQWSKAILTKVANINALPTRHHQCPPLSSSTSIMTTAYTGHLPPQWCTLPFLLCSYHGVYGPSLLRSNWTLHYSSIK